jgi:hypothetical protein
MPEHPIPSNTLRYARSGAVAGAISALAFTTVHGLLISDIWFSAVAMIAAGALSGGCIAWSYALLVRAPSLGSWVRYNLVYLGMFAVLGMASVLVFEPVTTVAALLQANAPPKALFAKAMPLTLVFLFSMTTLLSVLYGRQWRHYGPILLTCAVLIALLGLNVSVIGLVFVPRGSGYLIAELFGLIFLLDAAYFAAFLGLERRTLVARHARGGDQL